MVKSEPMKKDVVQSIVPRRPEASPFDVPSIRTEATTQDILDAIRDSRERG